MRSQHIFELLLIAREYADLVSRHRRREPHRRAVMVFRLRTMIMSNLFILNVRSRHEVFMMPAGRVRCEVMLLHPRALCPAH